MVRALQTSNHIEHEFLRAVYELTERSAKRAVTFVDAQTKSGRSLEEADQACDFWADRGVLEFTGLGRVSLTHIGLRRAKRLDERGWRPQMPF
jgi:hypothetical protein